MPGQAHLDRLSAVDAAFLAQEGPNTHMHIGGRAPLGGRPAPGSEEALLKLCARVFSQRLDRSKPLWEMWLVEGLESGGFALVSKTHHALIDGIAGVDLASVLFDVE